MQATSNLPRHVAIIMDGNGRWAKERGLPRIHGHQKGMETIRAIVRTARELGIQYLTLYAFSKENWARPKAEVNFLMNLLSQYLDSELNELNENQIRFNVIGRLEDLPPAIQGTIKRNIKLTQNNKGLVLTLALSYSSRIEIVNAAKRLCEKVTSGNLKIEEINEAIFSKELSTAGMPDPDLLIRTSGELRISNFLLWQISYTEIYVSDKYWPDFAKQDFLNAIKDFQKRERRYGRAETNEAGHD
ncbi:MAG: di-trans,poly-cis-decaprenylcistransferase [Omnitrophica bacterium RIFCSPHIGHO2_02_FULL_46_11]|nr:MAG: di-trans,poly-cis-decaprenylcistransferase [Omnitrophica bacterium RIFCSPLOWO2_01_FULL_45_10b]OGW85787.1 MAG: di-trans,poly-cis-decaprenylcistransferase [Omnitrophica bacterium RIFCSPHIGHO2_02_FULL_46_11]